MKKIYFGWSVILLLGMASCQSGTEELPPLPTSAVTSEVTKAMTEPSAATTSPVAPKATETPVVTAKPEATEPLLPTVALTPTSAPEPTESPAPTPTPVPTATPKPTATPVPTGRPVSSEIEKLLQYADEYKNTKINGTVCKSEAEANAYMREMSLTYSSYPIIVEDAAYLHSVEEYMTMYPEIRKMEMESLEIYKNGICMMVANVETVYDANLCYAMRTGDRSVLSDTEKDVYEFLEEVIQLTGVEKTDKAEAVKALHDYLVLELKYDTTFQEMSHSPEGVMTNKTAVCDGYARTMRLLLLLLDIECEIVSGTAGNQSHAWNLVKMEDGWYHVDVTWDDPTPDVEGKVGYFYFLKNDAEMAKTHVWESEIFCTGTKYQVYSYREVLCDSVDTVREVYEKQIQTEEYLVFCYPKGGSVTGETILDFVKNEVRMGITYYPETALTDYLVLEIVNPLMGKR